MIEKVVHNTQQYFAARKYAPVYVRLPVSATSSLPWPEHLYAMSGNPAFTPIDTYERGKGYRGSDIGMSGGAVERTVLYCTVLYCTTLYMAVRTAR